MAKHEGLLGNRFCQAQASCRYFKKLIGIFKALRWLFTESTTSHRLKPDYNHQSFQWKREFLVVFKCAGSKTWLQSMLLGALGFNSLVQEGWQTTAHALGLGVNRYRVATWITSSKLWSSQLWTQFKVAPYSFLTARELVSKSRDRANFNKSTRKSRATSTTASNSHWSNFSNYRCSFPCLLYTSPSPRDA